jgi:hypothetical protein
MTNRKYPPVRISWSWSNETRAEFIGENQVKLHYEHTTGAFESNPETTTDTVLVTRRTIRGREVMCFTDRLRATGEKAVCAYTYVERRGWIYVGAHYPGVSHRHQADPFSNGPVPGDADIAFKKRDIEYAKQFANAAQL